MSCKGDLIGDLEFDELGTPAVSLTKRFNP